MDLLKRWTLGVVCLGFVASCATTNPKNSVLAAQYYNLGNAWFELKKFDKASEAYQKALDLDPSLKVATLNWARTKAETGSLTEAQRLVDQLAQNDKNNLVLRQYQAWLKAKTDGLASAAPLYSTLVSEIPGDADTQFNAGLCFEAAERWNEAYQALSTWKNLGGNTETGLLALARSADRAVPSEAPSAWQAAVAALSKDSKSRTVAIKAWAESLERQSRWSDAVTVWQKGENELSGDDKNESLFRRGRILLVKMEETDSGIQILSQAWSAGYRRSDAWNTLMSEGNDDQQLRWRAALTAAGVKW